MKGLMSLLNTINYFKVFIILMN